jgi:hypothetical protein
VPEQVPAQVPGATAGAGAATFIVVSGGSTFAVFSISSE